MQTLRLADPRLVALHVRPQGGLEGGMGGRGWLFQVGCVLRKCVLQEKGLLRYGMPFETNPTTKTQTERPSPLARTLRTFPRRLRASWG